MQNARWFVVQTNPQREAFVDEQLAPFEPYLPRFKTSKGRVEPVFRSYLFVPATDHWSPIVSTVGVRGLLMSGEHPAVVPGDVIAHWRGRERNGLVQLPPPPRFRKGERLTILRGSLRYRSVVYAGMASKDRERVLIDMLGQSVTLTVPSADLASEFPTGTSARNFLRNRREVLSGDNRKHC